MLVKYITSQAVEFLAQAMLYPNVIESKARDRQQGVTIALHAVTTEDYMTADWGACPRTCPRGPAAGSSTRCRASTASSTTSQACRRRRSSGNAPARPGNTVTWSRSEVLAKSTPLALHASRFALPNDYPRL